LRIRHIHAPTEAASNAASTILSGFHPAWLALTSGRGTAIRLGLRESGIDVEIGSIMARAHLL
jgi:hypothetical protein